MRILRLVVVSIVVLFCILLIISLFIPKHISISRSVEINAPKQKVFEEINDLKKWDEWNHFTSQSSLTNKIYSNPSSGYPALMKSDQLNIIILDSKQDSIKTNWDQFNAKRFDARFNLIEQKPGKTVVLWFFEFTFKWYPWEKFSALIYDKQFGAVMDESLTDLKRVAENNP